MSGDDLKEVALWPRVRGIKERRKKEADDVRLVSELGRLHFFGVITERQFEAGEWWRRAGTWQVKAKYSGHPFPKVSQYKPRLVLYRDDWERLPSNAYEQARKVVGTKKARLLNNLCVYDQHPGSWERDDICIAWRSARARSTASRRTRANGSINLR
jgi:hypothetical protein